MGIGFRRTLQRPINRLFLTGTAVGVSDAQLLERFLQGHDEGAESAFNVLVERHGPMVLAVCCRALGDPHDAQDAFQATFLILVRKAGAIRKRESIADWLHGVARRVSARARADAARRRSVEQQAVLRTLIASEPSLPEVDVMDEVEQLPHLLRAPIVLCYLEGLTHDQAARRLGWPVGTVRSRLARARARLRADLARRGIAPDAPLLPLLSLKRLSLPDRLIETTIKSAMLLTARDAAEAGLISAAAVALAEGVIRTMLVSKMKLIAAFLVATGAIGSGIGLCAYQGDDRGAPSPGVQSDPVPRAVEPGPLPKGVDPRAAAESVRSRAITGIAPRFVNTTPASGEELDNLAWRVDELVHGARRHQAEGDFGEAIRKLTSAVEFAKMWQNALMKRRVNATIAEPPPANPAPKSLAPQVDARPPASAGQRLEDLERKVDRILRALERDGRAQDEGQLPAQKNRNRLEEEPESLKKPSDIPDHPRAKGATANDSPMIGDLARLQGTWTGMTGTNQAFQTVETYKGTTGRTDNTTSDGREIGLIYRFEIDEHATPHKRIRFFDIARYGGGGGGPNEVYGIYKFIDDNTIMYCNGFEGKYPEAFENSATTLVCTLKRASSPQKNGR